MRRVYGVLAYAVTTRRHEFGIRRALGAGTPQVLREVFREGLRLALVGSPIGCGAALIAGRFLQNQLYSIQPRDPVAFGVSLALVLAGASFACWIPGRARRPSLQWTHCGPSDPANQGHKASTETRNHEVNSCFRDFVVPSV